MKAISENIESRNGENNQRKWRQYRSLSAEENVEAKANQWRIMISSKINEKSAAAAA
jgi:hypothetical protein